ncbi:hypothetical protein AAC387_Pa03g1460 [Persea americana]
MLRACVLDFKAQWDEYLPLCEFAYNNSYHSSIGMAPFEALYGRRCRTPVCWEEVGVRSFHGPTIVGETSDKINLILERLKVARSRQKSYANTRRRELQFKEEVFQKLTMQASLTITFDENKYQLILQEKQSKRTYKRPASC